MKDQDDFHILQDQLWYRIPVATAPKRWPPKWLAFYQTKIFGDEAFAVHYYGRVRSIRVVRRHELFPQEPPNPKSDRRYFQVHLHSLERLDHPILSPRWRRIVFIPTTWQKFRQAQEVNDLFDDSPLEDHLWIELRKLEIPAERQWDVNVGKAWYKLDFALFCAEGKVDVETDGDTWHADPKRIPEDNRRDNDLEVSGWHVLRFNGHQIRESINEYCVPKITQMINRLDGLDEESLVPRTFYSGSEGIAQQLTLFDGDAEYELDEDE
jgi:very-short-patch-repair endonuclease